MGKLIRGVFWDSPKAQIDTILGRDMKWKDRPFQGIEGGAKGMTAQQRKEFRAREKAKGSTRGMDPDLNLAVTNTPLTERYS